MPTGPSESKEEKKGPLHGLPSLLDSISDLKPTKFDPVREREKSLRLPITPGAKAAAPIFTLPELRVRIQKHPEATVVFSDVHGYVELLEHAMNELGLRRGEATRPRRVGSIGDLVDGRTEGDAKTLLFAKHELDFVTAGNHEVALMGGPSFGGQPYSDKSNLGLYLQELADQGVLVAAQAVHGILLTHAGVNSAYSKFNAEETAEFLNSEWDRFLTTPRIRSRMLREPKSLLAPSPLRTGGTIADLTSGPSPGCFWQSWEEFLLNYPNNFRQIVGHTPRGRIEISSDALLVNIDTAGYRLGIALITEDGEIVLGSDFTG